MTQRRKTHAAVFQKQCDGVGVGGLCFIFTIGFLIDLEAKRHGNYEYYGGCWWAYCGASVIGWFTPVILAWILRSLSRKRDS